MTTNKITSDQIGVFFEGVNLDCQPVKITDTVPRSMLTQLLSECLSILYTLQPDQVSDQVKLYDLEAKIERTISQLSNGEINGL